LDGTTHLFEGTDRKTGARRWTAPLADLIFGSNAQLRALSEVYAREMARRTSCRISCGPGQR
jgi:catalase-peroxidase